MHGSFLRSAKHTARWGEEEFRRSNPSRSRRDAGASVFFSANVLASVMPRPVGAAVLTILGGFFIIGGGLVFAFVGALFAVLGFVSAFFLVGLLIGVLTLIVGLLMLIVPLGHVVWGALAVVLALASIPFALGGFVIGFILTLIGGILALRWKRPAPRAYTTEGHVVPPPS
jgi:hypothetical protein